ncbi:hypothetical protein ACJZ2D_001068 [Fusarium nematophilum]
MHFQPGPMPLFYQVSTPNNSPSPVNWDKKPGRPRLDSSTETAAGLVRVKTLLSASTASATITRLVF